MNRLHDLHHFPSLLKNSLRQHIPPKRWTQASTFYWMSILPRWQHLSTHFAPEFRRSRMRIREFHDLHDSERCIILGNGPSLRSVNVELLRNAVTIGTNRIYLLEPGFGFLPTYYVAVNTLLIGQCADEIRSIHVPKFITWRARHCLQNDPDCVFINTDYAGPETFSTDLRNRIFEGSTVTFVALQIAYYMGFREVVLLGVDHHYEIQGQPHEVVVSRGKDPNHFSPDYFPAGFKWQNPDLDASARAYAMARSGYERAGRRVIDATPGGRMTVFEKGRLQSMIGSPISASMNLNVGSSVR